MDWVNRYIMQKTKLIKVLKKQAIILGIWILGVIAGASAINWYYLLPTLENQTVFEQRGCVSCDTIEESKPEMAEDNSSDDQVAIKPKAQEESTRLEADSHSVIATTYNAESSQTDSDPFTMASGKRVYEGAVASNCHPLGTKLEIEGKQYNVEDRMNARYTKDCGTDQERIDIFKWKKEDNFKKIVKYAKV